MKKQSVNKEDAANLRKIAEERLSHRNAEASKFASEAEMMKLIHELEVHQIELELQNEELILANIQAREATEKFKELYDLAPAGYFTLSRQGQILEMNLRSAQMLGKERSLLINSNFGFFIKEDSRGVFKNFLEEIFQENSHVTCDLSLISNDNVSLHVHLTGIMTEKKEECQITAIDITERKKAEDELKKNLAKYKVLIDTFPIAITISDPVGNIVETNEKALELLGLSREEHLQRKLKGEEWKIIKTDGSIFPQDEYASVKALNENRLVENVEMGIEKPDGTITWLNVTAAPIPIEELGVLIAYNDITERNKSIAALQQIEWMLSEKKTKSRDFAPDYGDLSELNKNGLILSSVGKEQLIQMVSEYLDLLETSSAIYEKNGDYALGLFSSSWCQKMDSASRKLCNTENHIEALNSGEWLCHESCWHDASLKAIASGKSADVACKGGIRLFAVPIYAQGEVIGAINFGYGEPPKTDAELEELSALYQVPVEELRIVSQEYQVRPQYIIDYAKKRIEVSARYIGNLIERKQAEILLQEKSEEIAAQNEELFQTNQELIAAKEKAVESEEKYRALFINAPLSYQSLDENGCFIDVNPKWLKTLGYERSEVIGKWFGDFLHPEYVEHFKISFHEFKMNGCVTGVQFKLKRKDSTFIDVSFEGSSGYTPEGKFKQSYCVFKDITEQKVLETELKESEERFKLLHNASFGGIAIHDKGIILECNQGLSEMTGYSLGELIGMDGLLLIAPEHREMVMNKIVTGYEKPYEANGLRKNGDQFPMRLEARNVPYKGKNVRTVEFRDITESKQAEMIAIKERSINDTIIESTPGAFYMLDENGNYVRWNAYQRDVIVGKPESMVPGTNAIDTIHPDDRALIGSKIANVIKNGVAETVEGRVLLHGGPVFRWMLMTGRRIMIEGKPYLLGIGMDITERKLLENALSENEERLRIALKVTNDVVWDWDIVNDSQRWNEAGKKAFGWTEIVESAVSAAWWMERIHPDDRQRVEDGFYAALNNISNIHWQDEYRFRKSDGTYAEVIDRANILRDNTGKPLRMIGAMLDITERRKVEKQIQESEQRFRTVADFTYDMEYWQLPDGQLNYISPSCERITGYSKLEFISKPDLLIKIVYPDDLAKFMAHSNSGETDKSDFSEKEIIFRIIKKDSAIVWIEHVCRAVFDDDNNYLGRRVSYRDITTRVLAEESVRSSEEKYRLLAENSADVIWMTDSNGYYTYLSRSVEKVYGYKPEEALGLSMILAIPPEQREKTTESFHETVRYIQSAGVGVQPFMIDLEQIRKDGSRIWVETLFKALFDENEQFSGFLGITRDITERKKALFETQRHADEQILMAKIAHELVGMDSREEMYQYIAEQIYMLCNDAYLIMSYYDEEKEELLLKSAFGLEKQMQGLNKFFGINPFKMSMRLKDFPVDELEMVKNRKLNHFEKDGIYTLSGGMLSKKLGKMVEEFLKVRNTYLMGISWNEKIYGMIGIISRSNLPIDNMALIETIVNQSAIAVQRLYTSEQLKRSESRYRTLVDMSPDGIGLFKTNGELLNCNLQMARTFGYADEAELLSLEFNANDLISEDDRKRVSQNMKLLMKGKSVPLQTYKLIRKDGSVFPAEVNSVTVRDEIGNSLRLLSIVRDVTERIRVEETLARYNEQLRSFAGHNEMVREQERLNLARDIHDILGSSLAGLKMELAILKKLLSDDLMKSKPDIPLQINSMSGQIDESVAVMRKIVRELRPGILDELGLVEAIKWYAGEIATRSNIVCKMKTSQKLINFDRKQSVIIFRIYQEIMTNIVLHSKATKVTIQVDLNDKIFQLSVNDNGIGISADAAARTDSFGLMGMKERALLVDGKLTIIGSKDVGTNIILEVPVNK